MMKYLQKWIGCLGLLTCNLAGLAATDSVTANLVKARFEATGMRNVHPRLFFASTDINRVKLGLASADSFYTLGYAYAQREASQVLADSLLHYYLDAANLRVPSIHRFAAQLPWLVMMYQLTGERPYADRAWQQLSLLARFPDWGQNRHFLDAGIGAFNLALAYDGLYHYLSPAQRDTLAQVARTQVLEPGMQQMKRNVWWHTIRNNWNGICNGGLIMLSLALYERDPDLMAETIATASSTLPNYLGTFEPDGQSEEGVMYWAYGINYTVLCFETMNRVLGTNFGLADAPGLRKTGWFPISMSGPVTALSVGDDPLKRERARSLCWFGRYYADTALAALQRQACLDTRAMAWHDLLYYDAGAAQKGNARRQGPLSQYIKGIDYMILRGGWKATDWFAGMHGGANNASHGHLDAGSFDLQAKGVVWAYSSLGRDDYTYPGYFTKETYPRYTDAAAPQDSAGRWHFFRLRAESKNCLVFNPDTRPDQDPMGQAVLLNQDDKNGTGSFALDLTPCYHRDATQYHRTLTLDRKKQQTTVEDRWTGKNPGTLWWSMFTRAEITLSANGKVATLRQQGQQLTVEIAAPASAVFTVMPAAYLPGQSFPLTRNSSNKEFSRLAIRLDNVTRETIRVVMY